MPLFLLDRPVSLEEGESDTVIRLGSWAFPVEDPSRLPPPDLNPYPTADALRRACRRSLEEASRLCASLAAAIPAELGTNGSLPTRFWDQFLFRYCAHLTGLVEDIRARCESLNGRPFWYGAPLNAAAEPPRDFPEYLRQILSRSRLRIRFMDVCVRAFVSIREERPLLYQEGFPFEAAPRAWNSWRNRLARSFFWVSSRALMASAGRFSEHALLWDRYHLGWWDVARLARMGVPLWHPDSRYRATSNLPADPKLRHQVFGHLPPPYPDLLTATFPVMALEELHTTLAAAHRLIESRTGKVKRLYTFGQVWGAPEPYRAAASLLAASGAEVVNLQHGGGYAAYDTSAPALIEYRLSDRFVSWGWKDAENTHESRQTVVPLPSLYLSRLGGLPPLAPSWDVLVLVSSDELYPKWLYTPIFPECAHDYFQREKVLLDGLQEAGSVAVKLYPLEFGWRQNDWIRRAYPHYKALTKGSFPQLARRTKFCVVDYNATGFLELLAMGRPFMATWNRRWFQGSPLFERHLDRLAEAGIFYDEPDGLLKAYHRLRPQIKSWWREPARRDAVEEMAHQFARTSPQVLQEWRRFLECSLHCGDGE